jgi:hypothetical protein
MFTALVAMATGLVGMVAGAALMLIQMEREIKERGMIKILEKEYTTTATKPTKKGDSL